MTFRTRMQLAEALGPVNRWYCSQAHGRQIEDPNLLITYFIKSGGAADFSRRYDQAIGTLNRWYCSEFYRRDIQDPAILWEYYMNYAPARASGTSSRHATGTAFSMAC